MYSSYHPNEPYVAGHRDGFVDKEHHGALILDAALFMACCAALSCIARFTFEITSGVGPKHKATKKFRKDDMFIIAAAVVYVVQLVGVCHLTYTGAGTSQKLLTTHDLQQTRKTFAWFNSCIIVTLALCKLSYLSFIRSMVATTYYLIEKFAIGTMWFVVCWGAATIIGMTASCGNSGPALPGDDSCIDFTSFWMAMGALDIVTDVVIFAIPAGITLVVKRNWLWKLGLVVTFSIRLAVPSVGGWRMVELHKQSSYPEVVDVTLSMVKTLIVSELQVCLSMISCNILFVKSFMVAIAKARTTEGEEMIGPVDQNSYGSTIDHRKPLSRIRSMLNTRFGVSSSEQLDVEAGAKHSTRAASTDDLTGSSGSKEKEIEAEAVDPVEQHLKARKLHSHRKSPMHFRKNMGTIDDYGDNSLRVTREVTVTYDQRNSLSARSSLDASDLVTDDASPNGAGWQTSRQTVTSPRVRSGTPLPDLEQIEEEK